MKVLLSILICSVITSAWALDSSDVFLIDQFEMINTNKKQNDWTVNPAEIDKESIRFRSQDRDLTPWRNIDAYEWLDFNVWMRNRKLKDENKNWRKLFRESMNQEVVGRVLKCLGLCQIYRGNKKNNVEFMSKVKEGDELVTRVDSALWIVLVDGTLVRMAAKTSVSFNEINISPKQVQHITRLNYGFANFISRRQGKYKALDKPETDLGFRPLKVLEANREFAMIQEYRSFSEAERLKYSVVPNPGYQTHYDLLNKAIEKNTKTLKVRDSFLIVYTPNATIELVNSDLDIFYGLKNTTQFRIKEDELDMIKTDTREQLSRVNLRGYLNDTFESFEVGKWYETDAKGKTISELAETSLLEAASNFTKRIPSILLAREKWLEKHSIEMLSSNFDYEKFAMEYGYRVWDVEKQNELADRLAFAREYIRRTETTNLKNIDFVFRSIPKEVFNREHIRKTLRLHYDSLRKRYDKKRILVREMTDTQYYLWTLRYGQKHLSARTR